ncbi:MAG: hypothetical protein IKO41_08990 [Lachnospiraceae bacterium]|nr:hypothetical protein [Lachnospiraceae bacterium]
MSLKTEIMDLLNGKEGMVRINNVSFLKRWTEDALGNPCDVLKLDFDTINDVNFGIYDTYVKSRDYDGIIEECAALTERFFAEVTERLCKDMKAGYRNRDK